ncbi:alpha-L-fucosidase [Confluentibacter sediminis]|uniref:alpha-L-fucosidase n=1 Tax=Confluentibacter sediminis TaxID=2219045 RepID=UPI000DAD6DBB|nr:alpha-L-fucosidase [Confluentibacter sediminis]
MRNIFKVLSFLCIIIFNSCKEPVIPPSAFGPIPTQRQLDWHDMEFYAFIHFTINTFTDKEWGFGDESPELFNPSHFDAQQIVSTAKNAGMKGLILTTKHHDGFCLWPTKTTEHNISKSPYKNGKGDIVKEIFDECRKQGLKVGVYLSPWDRNNKAYGTPEYIKIFRDQLRELLTNYRDVFEVWFDGANGGTGYYGGANEERKVDLTTYYDWENTWEMIRELQPKAVIFSDVGPDVRWIGTEEGYSGDPCWNRYTPKGREEGQIPAGGLTKYWESINGHRDGKYWMPAETNTSIRPGWFYHKSEDDKVKTPEQLVKLYYESIGHGTSLILNLPPDRRGVIHENDVKSLIEFKKIIDKTFSVDYAQNSKVTASNVRGYSKKYSAENVLDNDDETYWATNDEVKKANLVIEFPKETSFNVVNIKEYIPLGQRVWGWALDRWENNQWIEFAKGESIGHRRLWRGSLQVTNKMRFRVTEVGACPLISKISVYQEPVRLSAPVISRSIDGDVTIKSTGTIHYTINGDEPTEKSPIFNAPFSFVSGGTVKAKAFFNGKSSGVSTAYYGYSKRNWKVISVGSEDVNFIGKNTIDENETTYWKSSIGEQDNIVIDMGETLPVKSFIMLPRTDDSKEGLVTHYEFYLSNDNTKWVLAAQGEFSNIYNNPIQQVINLDKIYNDRYIKFVTKEVVNNGNGIISEIGIGVD